MSNEPEEFAAMMQEKFMSGETHPATADLAARLAKAEREIERCHKRLEIDHAFKLVDGGLERFDVPKDERASWPDAVSCRDETIAILEHRAEAAERALEEAEKVIKPFADQAETFDPNGNESIPDRCTPAIFGHTIGHLRAALKWMESRHD